MRAVLFGTFLTVLTGCGSTDAPRGAGFGDARPASTVAASIEASQPRRPLGGIFDSTLNGVYKTSTGVPWWDTNSDKYTTQRKRIGAAAAKREATKVGSSKLRRPHVVPDSAGERTGVFRIVSVDGHTFGVLYKVSSAGFFAFPNPALDQRVALSLMQRGLQIAGCKQTGEPGFTMVNGVVVKSASVPAVCTRG